MNLFRRRTPASAIGAGISSETPDEQLMGLLGAGQDGALDEVIARYGARVQSYVSLLVRNHSWAEELTQEVFVRAYEQAARYDPAHPFAVWLFRIARNLAVDLLRREDVRQRALDTLEEGARRRSREEPSGRSPLEELGQREFQGRFERSVEELPEPYRSVFLLRHFEGLSYEEIAEVVGIPAKTVSTRLHRARMHLRRALAGFLEP